MNNISIRAENLAKQYRLGGVRAPYQTIREQIITAFTKPLQRVKGFIEQSNFKFEGEKIDTIWALRDASFEIKQGETVGIVGRNGAGKSTLLKLLAYITEPTIGRAEIYGRVGSLLEVGTGFHPELTGRENIYLNGAILGMQRVEIRQKFDEIVAFAEIEPFLDTPVKHYSSGMYMRLAFAVAAHLEPEILLVDEVLAVGDASFQNKCLGKMEDVAHGGRTVLFVSHNHQAVRRLCERCLWLAEGHVQQIGPTREVLDAYLQTIISNVKAEDVIPDPPSNDINNPLRLLRLAVCDSEGHPTSLLEGEKSYTLEIEYEFSHPIKNVRIAALFRTAQDVDAFMTTDCDDILVRGLDRLPGRYITRFEIPANFLTQGR